METILVKKSKTKKVLKFVGLFFLVLIVTAVATEFIYKGEKETPMYKLQRYLTYSKEDWANYESMKLMQAEAGKDTSTTDVVSASPESPIDTMMWESSIKNKEFMPDGVLEEVNRYKKRDFSKLVIANDKPTDQEAQDAIVTNYQGEVTGLLKKYNATYFAK